MRVTKAMLEESNKFLQENLEKKYIEVETLQTKIKNLEQIIQIYKGMSSFTIAAERITQALTETIAQVKRR